MERLSRGSDGAYGVAAARRFKDLQRTGDDRAGARPVKLLLVAGLALPLLNALLGVGVTALLGLAREVG